ncbi:hypothetical protein FPQ18DRAFT_334837 [Pyronema domesticum]|nr:hypothetical protein FPQ18DRAFT_334837 [Pyronema domesticum]
MSDPISPPHSPPHSPSSPLSYPTDSPHHPDDLSEQDSQRLPSITRSTYSISDDFESDLLSEDNFDTYRNVGDESREEAGSTEDFPEATAQSEDHDSQWESEGPAAPKSRKKGLAAAAQKLPKALRPTSSGKLHPRAQYLGSRASSASYNETVQGEKKSAPLVLLHITLLFLPGAEEAVLRKITPTMLERGLLIEHPRNDYQALEELIIDALGLDDALTPAEQSEEEEEEKDEWEQSLGVRKVAAKRQWEIRVYAANGLMTSGAWKRVWNEMERVDVEVGPKGWRGKKTDELVKAFMRKDAKQRGVRLPAWDVEPLDVGFWATVVGILLLVVAAATGLWWTSPQWQEFSMPDFKAMIPWAGSAVQMENMDGVMVPEGQGHCEVVEGQDEPVCGEAIVPVNIDGEANNGKISGEPNENVETASASVDDKEGATSPADGSDGTSEPELLSFDEAAETGSDRWWSWKSGQKA